MKKNTKRYLPLPQPSFWPSESRPGANAMHIMEGYLPAGFCVAWADEIFLFKDGRVLKSGTPEEVFTDTSALKETNLTQPAVLELFDSLCAKGILKKEWKIPRNLKELEAYISAL